jgi:hypothetical protein
MNRDRAKQNALLKLRNLQPPLMPLAGQLVTLAIQCAIDAIADELEEERSLAPAARARYAEGQTASPYDLQAQAELRAADAKGRKGYDY